MKRLFLLHIMYIGCLLYAKPNTINDVIAVDVKYIDWDIMSIIDIDPQNFESWNGYQLHITDGETIHHLLSQIRVLDKDSASSFDVRGKISIVFPHDTVVYYYSKFHLYDGVQYYMMSPKLEKNLLELTNQQINP